DRQVCEVRAPEPPYLSIEVREVAPLQDRVVAELDTRHDVLRAECDLLRLRERILHVAIDHEPADSPDRHELFSHELRRVERVERQQRRGVVAEHLKTELPLREIPRLD